MTGIRLIFGTVGLAALTACAPPVPDSARGVGFEDYDSYQARREAVLTGQSSRTTIQPPTRVTSAPLDGGSSDAAARAANSGVAPVQASPGNPAPQIVNTSTGISGENDFDAVSNTRSIEGDAALLAQNRARYQVIQPQALPTRPGSNRPNIVEYALQTTNPVGASLYRRSIFGTQSSHARNCGRYASADLAQEQFLADGGPQKDRKNLDPDGDGFACTWNPAPFRAIRN